MRFKRASLVHSRELILYLPPHSVPIKMKELEDVLGPFSKFGLLLGSQGIIRNNHGMTATS